MSQARGDDRTISYSEFTRMVRRFRRIDVLRACSVMSARVDASRDESQIALQFPQSSLAGIARAAICSGNNHRDKALGPADIRQLCHAFINIHDPFLETRDVQSFVVRMAHEQFFLQGSQYNDLARTQALLVDAAAAARATLITQGFWRSLLGCTTQELFGVALMLHTLALKHDGIFDPAWLDQPNFAPVFTIVPRPVVESVTSAHFMMDVAGHREAKEPDPPQGAMEKYAFNSLRVAPFVKEDSGPPIAPVTPMIWQRATPASLYFSAIKKHGKAFSDDLGTVFQHYVGQQLGLVSDRVLPEVTYPTSQGQRRSVDFMVVFPHAVVLVEAKATPMRADARRGGATLEEDVERAPGKAISQISETARLIREEHSYFRHVPRDRPCIGLVITMEPYHLVSLPGRDVPTWFGSARDLEHLVSCTSVGVDEALLRHTDPRQAAALMSLLPTLTIGHNSLLDSAWKKLPFGETMRPEDASHAPMAMTGEPPTMPLDA